MGKGVRPWHSPTVYFIEPAHRSIEKVANGFDRAAELIGSDELLMHTLWQETLDTDSLVDVISSADPDDDSRFRLCVTYDLARLGQVISGRGVLLVCGEIPEELARQVRDAHVIEASVEFLGSRETDATDWLKSELGSRRRIPAKRAHQKPQSRRRTKLPSRKA